MIFFSSPETYNSNTSITANTLSNPSRINDLDATSFASDSDSDIEITFDLGSSKNIDSFWFKSDNVSEYEISYGNNASSLTLLDTYNGNDDGINYLFDFTSQSARYWSLVVSRKTVSTNVVKFFEIMFMRQIFEIDDVDDFPSDIDFSTKIYGGNSYRLANGELVSYQGITKPIPMINVEWQSVDLSLRNTLNLLWRTPVQPTLLLLPETDRPDNIFLVRWKNNFVNEYFGETIGMGFNVKAEFEQVLPSDFEVATIGEITPIDDQVLNYNTEYSLTLDITGSTNVIWDVISGVLPSGLTLDRDTGEISGTPDTIQDAMDVTIQAFNNAGSVTIVISFEVIGVSASWIAIPNQQGREGVQVEIDVSSYFTQGDPVTTIFSVSLYSNSAGDEALVSTHVLYDTATIDNTTLIVTFDLTNIDIDSQTDIYVRVTAHQP